MTAVQDDLGGFCIGDGFQVERDIALQPLLVEQDVEACSGMSGTPVIVVGKSIWVSWGVDGGIHISS